MVILCFYILGSTADGFLSPALEKLATILKFSESLAGVTLLALGNGAPDVISSLSAAGSSSGGMFLAVGSLVGGGMFVSGVVSAVVMLSSPKPIHVLGINFLRDICFYIVALSVLVVASIVGELSVYFAVTFLVIYVCFVIIVVIMDKIEERNKAKRIEMRKTLMVKRATVGSVNTQEQQLLDDADLDEDAYYYKDENDHLVDVIFENAEGIEEEQGDHDARFNRMLTDKTDHDIEEEDDFASDLEDEDKKPNYKIQDNNSIINKEVDKPSIPKVQSMKTAYEQTNSAEDTNSVDLKDQIDKTKIEQGKNLTAFLIEDHYEETLPNRHSDKSAIIKKSRTRVRASKTKHKVVWSMLKMKKFLKKGVQGEESFSEMNCFNKVVYVLIDAPFDLMRRLTIPPADNEMWNRRIAAAVPFFSVFFVFAVTGMINFYDAPPIAFYIAEGVAFIISVLI